jgi:hypothetical protein
MACCLADPRMRRGPGGGGQPNRGMLILERHASRSGTNACAIPHRQPGLRRAAPPRQQTTAEHPRLARARVAPALRQPAAVAATWFTRWARGGTPSAAEAGTDGPRALCCPRQGGLPAWRTHRLRRPHSAPQARRVQRQPLQRLLRGRGGRGALCTWAGLCTSLQLLRHHGQHSGRGEQRASAPGSTPSPPRACVPPATGTAPAPPQHRGRQPRQPPLRQEEGRVRGRTEGARDSVMEQSCRVGGRRDPFSALEAVARYTRACPGPPCPTQASQVWRSAPSYPAASSASACAQAARAALTPRDLPHPLVLSLRGEARQQRQHQRLAALLSLGRQVAAVPLQRLGHVAAQVARHEAAVQVGGLELGQQFQRVAACAGAGQVEGAEGQLVAQLRSTWERGEARGRGWAGTEQGQGWGAVARCSPEQALASQQALPRGQAASRRCCTAQRAGCGDVGEVGRDRSPSRRQGGAERPAPPPPGRAPHTGSSPPAQHTAAAVRRACSAAVPSWPRTGGSPARRHTDSPGSATHAGRPPGLVMAC